MVYDEGIIFDNVFTPFSLLSVLNVHPLTEQHTHTHAETLGVDGIFAPCLQTLSHCRLALVVLVHIVVIGTQEKPLAAMVTQ